ncbi:MAG TPA: dihydrodipicolinate reductase C-terminal domain-containing protein [Methylomirabilota bacterium]|nr:dihydrodipicolinate reductase C-terminal domain-containing protein [Methylomirabilota bacterium]
MTTIIFGDGNLGRAIAAALRETGTEPRVLGRPAGRRHAPADVGVADMAFEASRGEAVLGNVESALAAGCRRFVIATTGWDDDRPAVDRALREAGATAVVAANLSIGAALFLRIVEQAASLFGAVDGFDPFIVEWHRRTKRDRPSGTARELARLLSAAQSRSSASRSSASRPAESRPADDLEVAVVRAGSSPGMHLVGFDAPGETIELRLTARDRSAYASGALAAAAWLSSASRSAGCHPFDEVVDEVTDPALAATA